MNAPKPVSPRARMQALQAIPDSQRTDAEWDELNELEIMFAPGNRAGGPDRLPGSANHGGNNNGGGGRRKQGGGKPAHAQSALPGGQPAVQGVPGGEAGGARKPVRKFRKKPPRPKDKVPA
ncbi:hypothetical protein E6C76_21265 [Pseudothauera nasutitermitis]|uniref:Uncharacterized protein n=1 Tax=Pseudothauera nasutitermitis TaxID=2565930 RepID=A0A4S4APN3_9RHOO|nr:hypothetical protein [Pseudothauera nasutitermitis]THF61122.1 hypothetical protein E6C76_21265 [Pseudothauera nasutitermitis]